MEKDQAVWQEYNGKEVLLQYQGGAVLGKMSVNPERNYMDFLPHVAYEANGKNVRLETEIPRRISLNVLGLNALWDIQTLRKGDLEKKVAAINREVGGSNGSFGFSQK